MAKLVYTFASFPHESNKQKVCIAAYVAPVWGADSLLSISPDLQALECDFEKHVGPGGLCGYSQGKSDDFDWVISSDNSSGTGICQYIAISVIMILINVKYRE